MHVSVHNNGTNGVEESVCGPQTTTGAFQTFVFAGTGKRKRKDFPEKRLTLARHIKND